MFNKILIANRGEIACRVIRTARKLGIRTVTVYSDADRNALHVDMADEAVHIGAAPSRQSYLQIDRVIDAAKKTHAEAVHPGYGFLSENADFCRACEKNNLVFIGPPINAIESMGSKSAAKRIMQHAGVPLVPGYHGDDQNPQQLKQEAEKIGYPVLLKATAGGGGKGMRQVWDAAAFDEALAAAKREALNGFGDDTMLVEKYLTQPRHVEIQVFCDQHHNAVYLFERDCSLQRRHQKVIEEAPAPGLSSELRTIMGETAIRAAQAIDYEGAGTVEFLLDEDGSFYFMEMNTRLQVEHPVTEMITNQDLVEWQIRVASGQPLPLTQAHLGISGHAIEARIYAEDPENDFLPVTGPLHFLQTPDSSDHVRIDTGVRQGDEISVYYDPMIAKLIVWDEDRDRALQRLATALQAYRISGITTNIDFLYNLATCPPFKAAQLDTGFIENHHAAIFHDNRYETAKDLPLAALYLILEQARCADNWAKQSSDHWSPWHQTSAWRLNEANIHPISLVLHEQPYELAVEQLSYGAATRYKLSVDNQVVHAEGQLDGNTLRANIDGYQMRATVSAHDNSFSMYTQDHALQFRRLQPDYGDDLDDTNEGGGLSAPMNGTVVTLLVKPGTTVEKNDPILIMEAMKMEHTICAPSKGRVVEFYYQSGDLVDGGAALLNFQSNTVN